LSILVPFGTVTEDFEVVLHITRRVTIPLLVEERLGADEPVWESCVDQHVFREGKDAAIVTKGLPIGPPDKVNFKSSGNAIDCEWRVQTTE
jgi:hypothetical protein